MMLAMVAPLSPRSCRYSNDCVRIAKNPRPRVSVSDLEGRVLDLMSGHAAGGGAGELDGEAAVDDEGFAGDEAGEVGDEE